MRLHCHIVTYFQATGCNFVIQTEISPHYFITNILPSIEYDRNKHERLKWLTFNECSPNVYAIAIWYIVVLSVVIYITWSISTIKARGHNNKIIHHPNQTEWCIFCFVSIHTILFVMPIILTNIFMTTNKRAPNLYHTFNNFH